MPNCAMRTTFIVGFPGETQEEFDYLLDFMREARMDRVGAFIFSREPGTPSHDMEGQVPFRIKRERYDKLMRIQQGISLEINQSWIGKRLDVVVDEVRDGWVIGRSHRDAPEIDGLVYARGQATPGEIVEIEITGAEPYDLYGDAKPLAQILAAQA
jgi:ribosomal protein S12 methylthiotransferase